MYNIFIWLIIGAIAGFLAGNLQRGSGFGLIGNIVIGLIGSFIGGYVFSSLFGIVDTNFIGSILVSTAGAFILLFVASLFSGNRNSN